MCDSGAEPTIFKISLDVISLIFELTFDNISVLKLAKYSSIY